MSTLEELKQKFTKGKVAYKNDPEKLARFKSWVSREKKKILATSTPPPQSQPAPQPTPPPQAVQPQFDEETQKIYDDMDSRTPEETRDMAMAVETGVPPQVSPQIPYTVAQGGLNTSKDYSGIDIQGAIADVEQRAIREEETGLSYDPTEIPLNPSKGRTKQQAIADAGAVMKKAVKDFADSYMNGTNIDGLMSLDLNFGDKNYSKKAEDLLVTLADEVKTTTGSERRMKQEQLKKVQQVVLLLQSSLGKDGEIKLKEGAPNVLERSIAAGKQNLLASESSGTLMQALLPETFDAIKKDKGIMNETLSAITDFYRIPGNLLASSISSGDDEGVLKHMGINPSDKRMRDQILGELGNALNYLAPSGKAGASAGPIRAFVAKYSGGSLLDKGANLIPKYAQGGKKIDQLTSDLNPAAGDYSKHIIGNRDKAMAVDNLVDKSVPYEGRIRSYLKELSLQTLSDTKKVAIESSKKLLDAGILSSYQQAPETLIRSMEYLTDGEKRASELLTELLIQTAAGSVLQPNMGKGMGGVSDDLSPTELLFQTGRHRNADKLQGQLSKDVSGLPIKSADWQSQNLEEVINFTAKLFKDEKHKRLEELTRGADIEVTDLLVNLKASIDAQVMGKKKNALKAAYADLERLAHKRGYSTADYKIGEQTRQLGGREVVDDVTIKVDPNDMGALGKAKEGIDIDADLAKTDFEDLKNINANINKLKKNLENIRASDFQTTSKQGIGGGQKFDQAESIQKEIDGLQSELDNLTPANFTESTAQMVGKGGELSKLKDELKNIKASDFTEESVSYVNGKKVKTGGKTLNKEKFNARKLELEEKIKEVETSKGSGFDKKSVSSVDVDKFNQYKNELSNTLKSLKEDLGVASKEPNYGASKTRSVTETDTDAMNQAKVDLNDEIESERLAAGDAGRIGGEVIEDKAKNIQKLEAQSESLSQGVVPGSERMYVSLDDFMKHAGTIGDEIFDAGKKSKSAKKAALEKNVWIPMRNKYTEGMSPDDAKEFDEILSSLSDFHVNFDNIVSNASTKKDGLAAIEKKINTFVSTPGADVTRVISLVAESSKRYATALEAEMKAALKGVARGTTDWRRINKSYKSKIAKSDIIANAELKNLSTSIKGLLAKEGSVSSGNLFVDIKRAVKKVGGLAGALVGAMVKNSRGGVGIATRNADETLEYLKENMGMLEDALNDVSTNSSESIGKSTKDPTLLEKTKQLASDVGEGIDSVKEGVETSIDYANQGIEGAKKLNLLKKKSKITKKFEAKVKSHKQDLKDNVEVKNADYGVIDPIMSGMNKSYKKMGFTDRPFITSVMDEAKDRDPNSYHPKGQAVDYRTKHLSTKQAKELERTMRKEMGTQYDVVRHKTKSGEYHIHVEPSPLYKKK